MLVSCFNGYGFAGGRKDKILCAANASIFVNIFSGEKHARLMI